MSLIEAWWNGLPPRLKPDSPNDADEAELRGLVSDARASISGVELDDVPLVHHLARFSSTKRPDRATFAALHLGDLCLAYAVASGIEAARVRFDADCWKDVLEAGKNLGRGDLEMAEFRRELESPASPVSLLSYSGRGSLHAWLRVALLRRKGGTLPAPSNRELREPEEVRALDAARSALREAVAELTPESRALLAGTEKRRGSAEARAQEEALLLRTRRNLFSKGIDRARAEEALRTVWRELSRALEATQNSR